MSYTPSVKPTPKNDNQKDGRKGIIYFLIAAIALLVGYIIYDKTQTKEVITQKEEQIVTVNKAKDSVSTEFTKVSKRFDSLVSTNTGLQTSLSEKNSAILKLKESISAILRKKDISAEELKKANEMIAELSTKVDGYTDEINKLKAANQALDSANHILNSEKTQLTSDKQNLQENLSATEAAKKVLAGKVDTASTLHASNINVTSFEVRKDGQEKETSKAKKVSVLRISCSIDENLVAPSGSKSFYVCVYNTTGALSGNEGTFTLRDGSEKPYTNKVDIDYETGKVMPISFNWKPGDKFVPGTYKIEIYNNGFKIGSATKDLKKGGLF